MERDLSEALSLKLIENPLLGKSPLSNSIRPTLSGLNWLAAPTSQDITGLVYRVSDGTIIEGIAVHADGAKVVTSADTGIEVVHIAASYDGRLIVVACVDGSLRCYDSTCSSIQHRWTIEDAHSHVAPNVSTSPSKFRANGAAKAGPVRSLSFGPDSYALLLADAGHEQLSIYNAAELQPTNLIVGFEIQDISVASASWSSKLGDDLHFVVGDNDGCIHICQCNPEQAVTVTRLSQTSYPLQDDSEGWSCTHLDWFDEGRSIAAGFCRVSEEEEEEEDDDSQGPDDSASHEAGLFIASVGSESFTLSDWVDLGDVVPFFSVPKNGRHVYLTSHVDTSDPDTKVLIVASNVGSDISVVAKTKEHQWKVIDMQEGSAAMMPTNDDDEYTFPVGIAAIHVPSADETRGSCRCLLVESTDGSLSAFRFDHTADAGFFSTSYGMKIGLVGLPDSRVEAVEAPSEAAGDPNEENSPVTITAASIPTAGDFVFGSGTSSFSFGSPTTKPLFGSGAGFQTSSLFTSSNSTTSGNTGGIGVGLTSFAFGSPASSFAFPRRDMETATIQSSTSSAMPIFGSKASVAPGQSFAAIASSATPTTRLGLPSPSSKDESTPVATFEKSTGSSAVSSSSSSEAVESSYVVVPKASDATNLESSTKAEPLAILSGGGPSTPDISEGGEKAARLFDSFDTTRSGVLPIDVFVNLMDEIGEGYSGDEFDEQQRAVDPDGSGFLQRSAFINWYVNLTDAKGDDKEDEEESLDSDDIAERDAERDEAKSAFAKLATGEGDSMVINSDAFPQLLESLGSTYCEEAHRKYIRMLQDKDGTIRLQPFLNWYVPWLFQGDDDDDDNEDDNEEVVDDDSKKLKGVQDDHETTPRWGEQEPTEPNAAAATDGWGNIFSVDSSTWKCDNCMLRNKGDVLVCAACETPCPGRDGTTANIDTASGILPESKSSAVIFGSGLTTNASSGFFFGVKPPSEESKEPMIDVSSAKTDSTPVSFGMAPSGITFGIATPAIDDPQPSGFGFGSGSTMSVGANPFASGTSLSGSTNAGVSSIRPTGFSFGINSVAKDSGSLTQAEANSSLSTSGSTDNEVTPSNRKPEYVKPVSTSKAGDYPPLPSKSPTPFSASGQNAGEAKSITRPENASTPGSNAPVPFQVPTSIASNAQASTQSQAISSSEREAADSSKGSLPAAIAGDVPLFSSLPNTTPFSVQRSATSVSKASTSTTPIAPSQLTGYPPISATAPNPFSKKAETPATKSQTSISPSPKATPILGGYAPISSIAPTAFTQTPVTKQQTITSPTFVSNPQMSASSGNGGIPFSEAITQHSCSKKADYPPIPLTAAKPFSSSVQAPSLSQNMAPFPNRVSANRAETSESAMTPTSFVLGRDAPPSQENPVPTSRNQTTESRPMSSVGTGLYPPLSLKAATPFGSHTKTTGFGPSHNQASKSEDASVPSAMTYNVPTPSDALILPSTQKTTSVSVAQSSSVAAPLIKSNQLVSTLPANYNSTLFAPMGNMGNTFHNPQLPAVAVPPNDAPGLGLTPPRVARPSQLNASINIELSGKAVPASHRPFSSGYEQQLALVTEKLNKLMAKLAAKTPNPEAEASPGFEASLERFNAEIRRLSSICSDANGQLTAISERCVQLKSRNADFKRKIIEIRRLQSANDMASWERKALFENQPLDSVSELRRRELAARAKSVYNHFKLTQSRLGRLEGIISSHEPDALRALGESLQTGYNRSKSLNESIKRLERRVSGRWRLHFPLSNEVCQKSQRLQFRTTERSLQDTTKQKLLPISLPPATYVESKTKKLMLPGNRHREGTDWLRVEKCLRSARSDQRGARKVTHAPRPLVTFSSPNDVPSRRFGKSVQPSPTIQPSPILAITIQPSPISAISSKSELREPLFSPPSGAKERSSWHEISTFDHQRARDLSYSLPQQLNTVAVGSIARDALGALGTTPEKANENFCSRKREGVENTTRSISQSTTVEILRQSELGKKPVFPAIPTKNNQIERGSNTTTPPRSGESVAPSNPPLFAQQPKSFGSEPQVPSKSPTRPTGKSSAADIGGFAAEIKRTPMSAFGDLNSLSDSLADTIVTSNLSSKTLSKAIPSENQQPVESRNTPDYNALLTSFYQQHNPSKVKEVAQSLEKYKGREAEMFDKLSRKYGVENPLLTSSSTPSSRQGLFGSAFSNEVNEAAMSTTGAPALFQPSTPAPVPAPSFAPNLIPSTGQSLFGTGSSTFSSTPASPFGQPSFPAATPFSQVTSSGNQLLPHGTPQNQPAFAARNPREMLVGFYQKYNPAKIAEVDKLLDKYRGNEEQMFRNLAKKYQLDPAVFGLQATPVASLPTPPSGAFGQLSALGGGTAFGSSSGSLGSPLASGFGGGFGQTSSLGSGFSQAPPSSGHVFGSAAGSSFSTASFGAIASFGSPSAASGFGQTVSQSGFGSPSSGFSSFGSSPFGAPRH